MGSPISSLCMYNGSNVLAVSRWCAKGSRVRRSRRIEVVDYALERVECWRSGVARWLWHCGPCSGDCWWLVVCCVLMMVGSNRRNDGDDVCILVSFRWVASFGWWSNRLFNCSCRIITLNCGRCLLIYMESEATSIKLDKRRRYFWWGETFYSKQDQGKTKRISLTHWFPLSRDSLHSHVQFSTSSSISWLWQAQSDMFQWVCTTKFVRESAPFVL
jgi:hypothetical protein